ncbi:(2Fe-2S)-binding protein [Bradyrhizobium sp. 83002]|uniref:(2Fe-2S)-binding protein n=1 Tax=Bradyrhizobium aeschynomenes TaxID=2734909 RepID=UPI001551CC89|nr:(2Fe-2S)-binding protein [Bradyrhizobium aeschynomenes]NPU13426.1 (2Fe-2S)-binding protein [Bradyrhizobium aeschynomenes]
MFRKLHEPAEAVTVYVEGKPVVAEPGENLAAVLLRQEAIWSRPTPVKGSRRAPYCMIGVCFDCLARVDGVASVQTCMMPVRDGMTVEHQQRRRCLPS